MMTGKSPPDLRSTSVCATTTSSRTSRSDDKFVNIEQNGFVVAGLHRPTSSYGRAADRAGSQQLGSAGVRLRLPSNFHERRGHPRRLRLVLHAADFNAIFAMAEGAQATAGASMIGNLTGAPNVFFNDPFSFGRDHRRAELRGQQ